MAPEAALSAEPSTGAVPDVDIVLKPLSHPGLGEIRIEENLFPIGRNEAPFAGYGRDVVALLSRRHARIFAEEGAVYVADLDSKNGTTVNGVKIRDKPERLVNGDELGFGGSLSYRVALVPRSGARQKANSFTSVTLTPERDDLGLLPIVIVRFPFLVSKTEEHFARHLAAYPHQVNYLSRRHAHIFLKGGLPWIEDLGSTNGTFVSSRRLEEHAVPVEDGSLVAFGGNHFVYRVSVQKEPEPESTETKLAAAPPPARSQEGDLEKTTFVGAADSFLDIFCLDPAAQADEEINDEALSHGGGPALPPGRFAGARHLMKTLAEDDKARRGAGIGLALAAVLLLAGGIIYHRGAAERDMKNLLASRDFDGAAAAGARYLERQPDNAELRALDTEALLKAGVPRWLAQLRGRDYGRAATTVSGMKQLARHDKDLQPVVGELEWLTSLESFIGGRGGVDAPIRIYGDEDTIKSLLKAWDDDANGHQMVFATISAQVPEFKEAYGSALSHLRKLQSDDSVYLPAIERLNAAIETDLEQGHPEALEAVIQDYAEKYPRLGGLDSLRQDLRQYLALQGAAKSGTAAAPPATHFSTPPFQARAGALPPSQPSAASDGSPAK